MLGWAVKECRDNKLLETTSAEYRLLQSMICLENDVDDNYTETKYDLCTMLRNIGGKGGLLLIDNPFFDWGTKAMIHIAKD